MLYLLLLSTITIAITIIIHVRNIGIGMISLDRRLWLLLMVNGLGTGGDEIQPFPSF